MTRTGAGGGWYNHVKGVLEDSTKAIGFSTLSIFQPAVIYPGNVNIPKLFGWLNEKMNFMLPGIYNTVGADKIGDAMVVQVRLQLQGASQPVSYFTGGYVIQQKAVMFTSSASHEEQKSEL